MLVPLRRGTNMASHAKLFNFPWYIFSNNSIIRYRKALWRSHVVYVSLFYNISFSWLYLFNGWEFNSFTCRRYVRWKPPIGVLSPVMLCVKYFFTSVLSSPRNPSRGEANKVFSYSDLFNQTKQLWSSTFIRCPSFWRLDYVFGDAGRC